MLTRAQIITAGMNAAFIQGSQNSINRADLEAIFASIMAGQGLAVDGGDIMVASLIGANMAITTDQPFTLNAGLNPFTAFVIKGAVVIWRSGAFGTACAGGIYSAASKGGNAWIANSQSYANLTAANKIVRPTMAAVASTDAAVNAPILSLTTANTGALTADWFLTGQIIDA